MEKKDRGEVASNPLMRGLTKEFEVLLDSVDSAQMSGLFEEGALIESQDAQFTVVQFAENNASWNKLVANGCGVPLERRTVQRFVDENCSVVIVDGFDPVAAVRHKDVYQLWRRHGHLSLMVHFQVITS